MSNPEPARLALYSRLQEVLGSEHAETLMANLPPQPSEQPATRSDIDGLGGRIDNLEQRFDRLEQRFDRLDDRMDRLAERLSSEVSAMHTLVHDQLRTYTVTTVTSMTVLTGVFAAVVTILR